MTALTRLIAQYVEVTPGDALRDLWERAPALREGEELEATFTGRADALKAMRWLWRERKRRKARLLEQCAAGGEAVDPDNADVWRGLTMSTRGATLVVRRPPQPKAFVVRHVDGTTTTIALGEPK